MLVGTEWLVDATGCMPQRLRDLGVLKHLCASVLADLDLHVVGEGIWHRFPGPGGVTALYLLTESHLALHTYPECGVATVNLYCCGARPRWNWEDRLGDLLEARSVIVRRFDRAPEICEAAAEPVAAPADEVAR